MEYVPESGTQLHQIRKGLFDDLGLDAITPIDRLGNPICLDKGSAFRIRYVDPAPELNQWKVISARLYSAVTNETYWEWTTETALMPEGAVWPPVPITVPNFIEYARFDIVAVATSGVVGEEGGEGGGGTPTMNSNEVFVVLQQPQGYMTTAWANVLR